MSKLVLYKKSFQKYWTNLHRDRSHLPNNEIWDGKHPIFSSVAIFSDENSFKENIKNPLCSVTQNSLMVVVERFENKVCIKFFNNSFIRNVGRPWFKVSKNVKYISVNLNNGNIYSGEILNYQKKRACVKRVRVNYFAENPLSLFFSNLKNLLSQYTTEENYGIATEACKLFLQEIDGGKIQNLTLNNRLFRFYLDKKGFKYPDNFHIYAKDFWGDFRKKMKKNNNKIVDTFMYIHEISGKKLKKVLHNVQNLNVENYKSAVRLFGEQWVTQDENLLHTLLSSENNFSVTKELAEQFKNFSSPKEIKRAFIFFKKNLEEQEVDSWTLTDHFRLYVQLKKYGDTEVEWKSYGDSKFFRGEHLDWSDKVTFYRKGFYERKYPDYFLDYLKPIEVSAESFFPVLLTNSSEYNDESAIQSNCVKSYIGYPSTLIVSFRKGDSNSFDRLTIEYRVQKTPNIPLVYINRVQTRSKYNQNFSDEWIEPLRVLDERMTSMIEDRKFQTYKLKKTCSNGVELESDTEFDENGFLVWTYEPIDSYDIHFMI